LLLGAFFEGIFEGFRGSPVQNLPALREDVAECRCRRNNQLRKPRA